MSAFLNALREEGSKEDCLVQIARLLDENRRLRDERDEAREKALDEAYMAWKDNYADAGLAILALKEPKP
jgi:hypothetical protein